MSSLLLVTGGAGYLGSLLVPQLLNHGYRIRVMDTLLYQNGHVLLPYLSNPNFEFFRKDICLIDDVVYCCDGVDGIVHLAALVGDPACSRQPEKAVAINLEGTKNLVEIAVNQNISKFVFASTCSNYGINEPGTIATEETVLRPVSLYADTKVQAEEFIIKHTSEKFHPIIMRSATLFGLSPRMRFDLVVNVLTLHAVIRKNVVIYGGKQWRPLINVADAADAVVKILNKDLPVNKGEQIFNIGVNSQNFQIRDLGKIILSVFSDVEVKELTEEIDTRSYQVDFSKFENLFSFSVSHTLTDGFRDIKAALESGIFPDPESSLYIN